MENIFFVRKRVLYPEKWVPDEADKPRIVVQFRDYYECAVDNAGAGSEEATEAFQIYMNVQNHTLAEVKDDVQDFFGEAYDAVHGQFEKYYDDPEIVALINLTLYPEWEDVPASEILKGRSK